MTIHETDGISPQSPGVTQGTLGNPTPADPRLAEAIDQYLDHMSAVGRRSHATVAAYRADLRKFALFAGAANVAALDDVTPPLIENWMASMRDLSAATVRRALNSLSSMYRWALRFGYARRNPLDQIERPRKKRRIEPCPKPEEIAAMLDATWGHTERAAFLAMATSGLRRAELVSVDWPDVDLRAQRTRIRGKGDKQREVVIFEQLRAALYTLHAEQHFPTEGPVFRGWRGRRLQMSTLQRWFTKWFTNAGLRRPGAARYTLHSLRRFAAKSWLNAGLNIRQVQILLGHEDLQTTMLYLNYDIEEIQRDLPRLNFTAISQPTNAPTIPASPPKSGD